MKVVLDVNVFVSAALSPSGVPAKIVKAWHDGAFELVISPQLVAELKATLEYPKLRKMITPQDVAGILDIIAANAEMLSDNPLRASAASRDPNDDYLISLAEQAEAIIVSGDKDLLNLEGRIALSPRHFYDFLENMGQM